MKMYCQKDEIWVTGCSQWTGGDSKEICLKCIKKGPFGDLDEKTHAGGQANQSPPIKHGYSAIKHRSKGVILIPTKGFLPHFGERGVSGGKRAKRS